jgi:integrase
MRSWLSVFCKFWKYVKLVNLKQVAPMIEARIATQEKKQNSAKQARTLTRESLWDFYNLPNTAHNLGDKAYAACRMSFARRSTEILGLKFEHVTRSIEEGTGEMKIIISYQRTKVKGVPERSNALITGALEVKILNEYEATFPMIDRQRNHFRKLIPTANGVGIKGTLANIGHNTAAKTARRIATTLGLPNPELYTGHTFRRSTATICAEAGMQLAAIKQVTGHKSDTVAQRYIDHSDHMKQGAADVLSFGGLQKDQEGGLLRKRPFQDIFNNSNMNTLASSSSSSSSNSSAKGTVVNITFNNCANVTYTTNEQKNT